MPITNAQRKVNDKWLDGLSSISRNWVWIDKGTTYKIELDNGVYKYRPPTQQAYDNLVAIVSPKFARERVLTPQN